MKRDLQPSIDGPIAASTNWRYAPVVAASLAAIGILVLYRDTAASIVAIWIRSETFAHGFIVIPITLWLIWRRREVLSLVPAKPWWPGLAIIAGAGALWMVTSAADVLGLGQFALAFMVIAAIVTVVGIQVGWKLLFPLAFLLFAVPVGEIFVPTLIDWTADFTVAALRVSGVPIYREANQFVIPSGAWSVVEACSGVRYLIASVMVGTIYAAVAYRSTARRAVFVTASVLVPIVANWLRAYMIVMIGHLSNNRLAAGVDHLIYGWAFFGLVMVLLFWAGSFWQEGSDSGAKPVAAGSAAATTWIDGGTQASAPDRVFFVAMLATLLVAAVWQPLVHTLRQPDARGVPVLQPIEGAGGWKPSSATFTNWKPHYQGYSAELAQTFIDNDLEAGLHVAYYRQQEKGRELITSGNLLVASGDWDWKQVSRGSVPVVWNGRQVDADVAELSGRTMRLQVFRLYWVCGRVTSSAYMAKALLAWCRLTGGGDDSALIATYTRGRGSIDDSRKALQSFSQTMSPAIERMLGQARESGR